MSASGAMPAAVEQRLRALAYEHTGIVLGPEKASLVAARVGKRLRTLSLSSYEDYLKVLEERPEEVQEFVNVITTNTTSFWREPSHFTLSYETLKGWVSRGQRRFRIWCAASSTGQEPYTIAITLSPLVEEHNLDLLILATDIDTRVLSTARAALYPSEAVREVPADVRIRAFEPAGDGQVRVADRYRRLVRFGQLNLTKAPFPMQGPLDFIFCRNVMIYLDVPTRQRFVTETERLLKPGGLLIIGHSESIFGLKNRLEIVQPSVYCSPARAS